MTVIEFAHISKLYRLGRVSTHTLGHDLHRWWAMRLLRQEDPYLKVGELNDRATRGRSPYVWALRDVHLKVEEGEVLGIIGQNGSGKSTLLKLLSKVTAPTTGLIKARGRIASLLEVGTGFHPEMTGRENLYMNGAIMGMSRAEISRKLDRIVDFSGCERYIDTPVKRYSSGMTVRLGFAIAAHLEPDILIVDEVLAVGDAEFQKKALGKMREVSKGEGRTVLFVSHNLASIRHLCHTGLLLEKGRVRKTGDIEEVVAYYRQMTAAGDLSEVEAAKQIQAPYLELRALRVNGGIQNRLVLPPEKRQIHVRIEVETRVDTQLSFEARFYGAKNHEAVAFFSPAHYTGQVPFFRAGKHVIEECIVFPRSMNECALVADFALTTPGSTYHLLLQNVLHVQIEGLPMCSGLVMPQEAGFLFLQNPE